MKKLWITLGVIAAIVASGAAAVWFGAYNVAATDQHLAPTYWLLDVAMRRSMAVRSDAIPVPQLDDERALRGAALFDRHCRQCHGAPGVPPDDFALGMTPVPVNLVSTARDWPPADLYWTIRYGIKMTGMPAWEFRLSDNAIWEIVAFMERMPLITPLQYAELLKGAPKPPEVEPVGHADRDPVARGKRAVQQYACVTCHQIPGITGPNAPVGPPLAGIAKRTIIAGHLPNTPPNMIAWLRNPREINPATAMPDLGISPEHAVDIAAFLRTLD